MRCIGSYSTTSVKVIPPTWIQVPGATDCGIWGASWDWLRKVPFRLPKSRSTSQRRPTAGAYDARKCKGRSGSRRYPAQRPGWSPALTGSPHPVVSWYHPGSTTFNRPGTICLLSMTFQALEHLLSYGAQQHEQYPKDQPDQDELEQE